MNRWNLIALTALLGLTLALPAAAQWKWRDKSGHTQYSDLPPPPGVPEGDILQKPAAATRRVAPVAAPASGASAAPLAAARASDPELEAKRKKAEQDVADKKKADEAKIAATKAENCGRAREQMRTLDSGQRMARVNDKGERIVLDDAARAAEAQRARDAMASECK
ncbi:MAG: DUF4124 domain-containing protein [Burkholderiales bacterium]